jgi:hypothetical protein
MSKVTTTINETIEIGDYTNENVASSSSATSNSSVSNDYSVRFFSIWTIALVSILLWWHFYRLSMEFL